MVYHSFPCNCMVYCVIPWYTIVNIGQFNLISFLCANVSKSFGGNWFGQYIKPRLATEKKQVSKRFIVKPPKWIWT